MQPSLPHEGQTLNTDSEHSQHFISQLCEAHIIFCGENAVVFNVKAVGTFSTVCNLKGTNPLFPDFNSLHKIPYFPIHKTHREFFVRNFRKMKKE
jgi:hypothetical protein